jgi:probable HAF family extracellular repeat protein
MSFDLAAAPDGAREMENLMGNSPWRSVVRLAAVPMFTAMAASADPHYQAVDLAAVVGTSATPVAIAEGVVAVTGFDSSGQAFSLLYDVAAGQVVYRFPAGDRVAALSEDGNAAGSSVSGESWLLSRGVRTAVPLAEALGLNDEGQVVGFAGGFFPLARLFNSADGTITDLGTLGGGQSVARAINSQAQVAGSSSLAGNQTIHAFRWERGVMQDLGTLGGNGNSFGNAIDGEGRVVGIAVTPSGDGHAFVFDEGGMHDLGTLPGCNRSEATAMNEHGAIVGLADLCSTNASRAFLFRKRTLQDVNDLVAPAADGFIYARATGIDDEGTIIGIATSPDGFSLRPFLLVRNGGD